MSETVNAQIKTKVGQLLEKYGIVESCVNEIEASDTNVARLELFEKLKAEMASVKVIESEISTLRSVLEEVGESIPAEARQLVDR